MDHILHSHEIVKTDFVRAQNCYLYDSTGRQYIDYESGIWCTILGHNHPRINQAICAQLDQVIHLGTRYPNQITEKASVELLDALGFADGKCVFLCSGSEAVEFAVQAARQMSGKPLLLLFSDSYLAAYGSAGKKSPAEWARFDWSSCAACATPEACDEHCGRFAELPFDLIGGWVFEPGSSSGLVRFPPKGLVQALERKIRQHGGLIIVNEITTGMGRTGVWFGFQHYDLHPDIAAVGKGLGNGYPVSAVAMSPQVASRLESSGLRYAQSHQNDPLGSAVAREVMVVFREEGWVERGSQIGERLVQSLNELRQSHACIREVRGRGMMIGIELASGVDILTAKEVYDGLLQRSLLTGYYLTGNLLRLDPALTIAEADLECLVAALDEIL